MLVLQIRSPLTAHPLIAHPLIVASLLSIEISLHLLYDNVMCLKVEDCRQSSVVSSFLAQYAWMAKKGEIKFYYYIYIILIILYYIFLYSYIYI